MTALENRPDLNEPTDATAILNNVQAILGLVEQEADPSNQQGYMTAPMGEALRVAGVYRAGLPEARGGPEVPLADQTRMVEMVARVDASIAWNVTVLAATGFYAGRLSDRGFAELYPTPDLATCGSFHPKGTARQVEGGYLVTGEWKFGSGIRSSDLIVGGAEVVNSSGEPVLKPDGSQLTLGVWLPRDLVKLRDDWHTIGLSGSGSQGYAVDNAFVPSDHTFDRFFTPNPNASPLVKHYDLPFFSMAGISIGIAQHAVDVVTEALAKRTGLRAPGERSFGLLGEAESCLHAMRGIVYSGLQSLDEQVFSVGVTPSPAALTRTRGDAAFAAELARRVMDICADLYGSGTIYNANPFEQLIRDLVGLSAHMSTSRSNWVGLGRLSVDQHNRRGERS